MIRRRPQTKRRKRGRGDFSPLPAVSGDAREMHNTPVIEALGMGGVDRLQATGAKRRRDALAAQPMPVMFELFPSQPLGVNPAAAAIVLADRGALFELVTPPGGVIREFSELAV